MCSNFRIKQDEKHKKEILSVFRELKLQALVEVEEFQGLSGDNNVRFYNSFIQLYEHLEHGLEIGVTHILTSVYAYDYNEEIPGNGYRSATNYYQASMILVLLWFLNVNLCVSMITQK